MSDTANDAKRGKPVEPGMLVADKFVVERHIAQGAMGRVYVATQKPMGRRVALKVMHPKFQGNAKASERFFREALAISKLQHPNTITLFDFGQADNGELFLAMELIDGPSLKAVLKAEGRLDLPRAVRIISQVALSLSEAHRHEIIHRDLKPANVLLMDLDGQPDFVKVIDFGIAQLSKGDRKNRLTEAGVACGTPAYMSPEQLMGGREVDGRSDVFSLASMLFELLDGKHPFGAKSLIALVERKRNGVADDLSPSHPQTIRDFVARCLSKDPDDRPQSCEAFLAELQAALPPGTKLGLVQLPDANPHHATTKVSLTALEVHEAETRPKIPISAEIHSRTTRNALAVERIEKAADSSAESIESDLADGSAPDEANGFHESHTGSSGSAVEPLGPGLWTLAEFEQGALGPTGSGEVSSDGADLEAHPSEAPATTPADRPNGVGWIAATVVLALVCGGLVTVLVLTQGGDSADVESATGGALAGLSETGPMETNRTAAERGENATAVGDDRIDGAEGGSNDRVEDGSGTASQTELATVGADPQADIVPAEGSGAAVHIDSGPVALDATEVASTTADTTDTESTSPISTDIASTDTSPIVAEIPVPQPEPPQPPPMPASFGEACVATADCAAGWCSNRHCAPDGYAYIPPARFVIGAEEPEDDETPHEVTLTRPFFIATREVTQVQWLAIMDRINTDNSGCDQCPAENERWLRAVEFLNALSRAEGLELCYDLSDDTPAWPSGLDCQGYRLPTEAEWEYAARAGSATEFVCGNRPRRDDPPVCLEHIAWTRASSGHRTHPVGELLPNAFGLFDVIGNAWEWVWDPYAPYLAVPQIDPTGPDRGQYHVRRGCAYHSGTSACRTANRNTSSRAGVRPVRSLPPAGATPPTDR